MTFLSLTSAWLALLLIPLVAFYFLKLKRPRQTIPSLVLWRQVINDQRVNSPFQRFKRNLLLLLQILILALLVLAAMQPLLRRESSRAARLPVLIDCSASMAALDRAGGQSRLDVAKERVRAMLQNLPGDQELCLIAFSKSARRLTGFTNNTQLLRDALDSLEVEEVPGELDEALRLTQSLARGEPFERVILISDGNFPARSDFELSFRIDYQRLPAAGPNHGITACNARRALGSEWDVFVQLGSSQEAESMSGVVELRRGETPIGSEAVTIVKGGAPRLVFKVAGNDSALIEARFQPNGFDSLGADNLAWIRLPTPRPLNVYAAPSLGAVRHALSAMEDLRVFPEEGETSPSAYDLVFTDQESDLALATRVQCTVGLIPEELQKLVSVEKTSSSAVDWRRESPLLQHVTLADVLFAEEPRAAENIGDADFANLGYEIVAHGPRAPLILEKHDREAHRVHLLFHTDRSTLPYRVGFPILVSNLVQLAMNESQLAEAAAVSTGVLPAMNVAPGRVFRLEGPGELRRKERSDERGVLAGIAAPKAGTYALIDEAETRLAIGASLLSASETSLAGVDQIEFAEQLTTRATSAGAAPKADRSLWWPLAFVALVALLVEWWFFQRPRRMTAN